jgi:hypothetical protein
VRPDDGYGVRQSGLQRDAYQCAIGAFVNRREEEHVSTIVPATPESMSTE